MANLVAEYRRHVGFTVKELSEYTGLSESTIYRIEREDNPFKTRYDVASSLADAFDVPIDELFDRMDISNLGRPAHSGKPIQVVVGIVVTVCSICNYAIPESGECDGLSH